MRNKRALCSSVSLTEGMQHIGDTIKVNDCITERAKIIAFEKVLRFKT